MTAGSLVRRSRVRAFGRRLVALLLSWTIPATSAWAAAPPVATVARPASGLALETVPGLSAALAAAALEPAARAASVAASAASAAATSDATATDTADASAWADAFEALDALSGGEGSAWADDRKERDRSERGSGRDTRPAQDARRTSGSGARPILLRCECVEDEGDGTFTAHFGYQSQNPGAVTVAAGVSNQIVPLPSRRDQPTRFMPGRSRDWPESAFRLRFDGQPVTWMLEGPDGVVQRATASLQLPRCGGGMQPCTSPFWGPKKFDVKPRGHGDHKDDRDRDEHGFHRPTEYEEEIVLPPGIAPPYRLTVVNGGPGLRDRVLLGSVFVDGRHVIGPFHLNPFVRQVTRPVELLPKSRLKLRLVGLPGSYVTLSICGSSAPDTTPPAIQVTEPGAGALLADATPSLRIAYSDPAGAGAASGVDPATLVVTLDGQERTAWFAAGPGEATGAVPASDPLAEGPHRIEARVRDAAGNETAATPVDFRVDSLPPQLQIGEPQDGTVTAATAVDVAGTVADASAIARLRVNGQDATVTGASFRLPALAIGDGPEVVVEAEAEDAAGNVGRTSVRIRVDRTAPTVAITKPQNGDVVQGPVLEVEGTVADDSDVRVDVNGTPEDAPPSLRAPRSFRAHVPITDGPITLTATARDAAGNPGVATVQVSTDTVPPTLTIDAPAAGLVTKDASVRVAGRAADASGIASVTVNGAPAAVAADGSFETDVALGAEGTQVVVVVATDVAGNASLPTQLDVVVDRTAPEFAVASPAADALVGALPVVVQGTVQDPNLESVKVDGLTATVTGQAWQVEVAGLGDGPHAFAAVARDKAGNETPLARPVRIDTAFPVVTIDAPLDGGLVRDASVPVTGTVRDATLVSLKLNGQPLPWTGDAALPGGASFTLPAVSLAEGPNTIEVVAEDALQRQGSDSVAITRDSLPPTLELLAPGLLVRGRPEKAVANASDAVSAVATVEFQIDGQPAGTVGQPPYEIPLTPPASLPSGESFTVSARATDVAGNASAWASRAVRVVSEGLVVGQVLADETSLPLSGARVTLLSAGAGAVAPATTDARGRYTLPVQSATALVVADAAGRTTVERELPVAAGSGAVPVDARLTLLRPPVTIGAAGGAVHVNVPLDTAGGSAGGGSTGGGSAGGGSTGGGSTGGGSTGGGSAGGGSAGGGSTAGPSTRVSVVVPPNAAAADTPVRLTALSPQALPGLLPLGWSPLAAFDLRADGGAALAGPLSVRLAALDAAGAPASAIPGWPAAAAVLAEYRAALHAWVLVEANLAPAAGEVAASLPGPGAFAFVVPDAGAAAPVVPAVGSPLAGVALAELPATAASRAVVEPAVLPPSGGTATGALVVDSPLPLPSGTVVQARVTETFSLATGATASEDERPMDIVLFRCPLSRLGAAGQPCTCTCPGTAPVAGVPSCPAAPDPCACPAPGEPGSAETCAADAPLSASVPITPSRSFAADELVEGKVHLDILAGRESARGTTGGTAPVVVTDGEARLSVAGMALASDTAVVLRAHPSLSSFLPSVPGLEPVAEVTVDLSGAVLQLAAELQVPAGGVPDGTFVVARVERVDGIPRLAVVALAVRAGDRLVTQPSAVLPGVVREGRHVFYRLAGPVGFVRGVTSTSGGGVKAVVTADGPFIAASEPSGAYVLTTYPTAGVSLQARVPGTPLQATGGPVDVVAGEASGLDLPLSGALSTARVTPPNGAAGIAVNVRIEVTPTVPLDPASLAGASVGLVRASDGQPVPVRLVLGVGGRSLSVIPERKVGDEFVPLEFATAYRLTVAGLKDTFGTEVTVPPSTFTTAVFEPPVLDEAKLEFDAPDANGIAAVRAPAGSFPLGTTVLIVNSTNGVVLSLSVDNEGGVSGELPARLSDRLLVTITDAQGNARSFQRSQFVIDAATGETAVGPGGGVVTSPGAPGYELRVPQDATDQAVSLRIAALVASDFPELPDLEGAEFGAGLAVTAKERPTFKKEVDVAFPLSSLPPLPQGAKPEEAFYTVVRELKMATGETYFQAIDEARVECPEGKAECDAADKKVVTASFPFPGLVTTFGGLTASFGLLALETARYLLMRTFNSALPGRSQWGVITGRVLRPVPVAGKPGQYTYVGVAGCAVRREGIGTGEVLAETSPGGDGLELGRLTFQAPWFTGGNVLLRATCGGKDYTGTAYVISGGAVEAIEDEGARRLIGSGNYETVGFVNITLPVELEPAPAPRVEIRIFREDADGTRTDLKGAAVAGSPVQIGVRAPGYQVREIKLRGESQTIRVPDPLKNTKPKDPLAFDAILQDPFTPAGAGSYVIEATALDPVLLTPVTGETVVQVLATPGGATVSVPGRPGVIVARTVPREGARGVSVSAFPQLSFTEPVKGIDATSVRLVPVGCAPPPASSTSTSSSSEPTCTDSTTSEETPGDPVPLRILAVTPDNRAIEITGTESPAPFVVSLTLQPLVSLSFGTKYRLEVGVPPTAGGATAVVDEDGELLVPNTSRFSTFLPEDLGQSQEADKPTVTGIVILGERGYVLETLHGGGVAGPQQSSTIRVYDVTDPVAPLDLTDSATGPRLERETIPYPPRDIAGEEVKDESGSPTGEKLIAVATAPRSFYQVQGNDPYWTELKSTPANLFLYDVSEPDTKPRWIGAANLTNNLVDGIPNRIVMQKGRIYAATFPKGIQVVSIENLRAGFPPAEEAREPEGQERIDLNKKLFAGGLNPGATVLTVPVKDPSNGLAMPLNDLEVTDLSVWGIPRKVVAATGSRPNAGLVLADAVSPYFDACDTAATTPKPLWLGPLTKDASSLDWGGAIALTRIGDIPHALVGGIGTIAAGGGGGSGGGGSGGSTAGSQAVLAIVDLTPVGPPVSGCGPRPSPTVVALIPLPKLNGVGDILLVGHTAIVSGAQGTRIDGLPGGAALVDFTDPENAEVVGYVAGVGSRMALGANEMLYSTARSFVKGTSGEFEGVRTATLGEAALITKVAPDPILVSASNEVFRNVDLSYKTIPPAPGTGEVSIDVRPGSRVATLPAEINESGTGTTRWPQGTIINPLSAYEARLHAQRDGEEMRSFPKRLRFDKVPLAITTRDRILRVQFALPEQGLFSFEETNYSVQVFLAAEGAEFPATPSFSVSSKQVREAYPNTEVWFDDVADGTAKAAQGWVTRKIDRMELPTGTDTTIRRQAFEIGAILTGYPNVKVVVVGEESGTELATKLGVVTALGDWSEMISRVNDNVRRAAGQFVPLDPILPAPGTFNPGNALASLGGLTFRALYSLLEQNLDTALLKGLIEGFHDGWTGDKDTVVMIGKAAISPLETAKAIGGFVKDFIAGLQQSGGITAIFKVLFDKLQQITLPTAGQVAYYTGYIVGFLFEQVLATVAIAVVTGGIGAVVAKAASLLKGVTWLASLAKRALSLLRSLAYALDGARQVLVDSKAARATLTWLKEIGTVVDDLWKLYPDASKIMQKAGRVAVVSKEVAQRALYWLTTVDRMLDDAAVRFITFFEKVGKEAGDRWLTRWTALRNGKRATKEAFEATDKAGEIADGAHDALVLAGDIDVPGAGPTTAKQYADKYADRLESSLARVKRSIDDAQYPDEAIGRAVRALAKSDIAALSDEAVEGAVKFMRDAGDGIPMAERQLLLERYLDATTDDADTVFRLVREAEDAETVAGFARIAQMTPCLVP